jgi:hypothetical protein
MERRGNTIEVKGKQETSIDIGDLMPLLEDKEVAEEFSKRFKNGEPLRRAICDVLGVGYHTHDNLDLMVLLKRKIQK